MFLYHLKQQEIKDYSKIGFQKLNNQLDHLLLFYIKNII